MRPLTPRERLRRALRHLWVEFRYMRHVWREFRGSLLFALTVWGTSIAVLHAWYPIAPGQEPMTWDRAAYFVLVMTAFEAALEFHSGANMAVKAVFYVLPLLGLFVIIDATVRFMKIVFERRTNKKEWQEMLASTYSGHVIVCGLGNVGYRTVQQLRQARTECVAIDLAETLFTAEMVALDVPVIFGDTRRIDTLQRAGVTRASAIVVATDVDLVNIETCLNARELNPGIKTVLRLFDHALAKKLENLVDIDAAFSTSALAAPVFAAAATSQNVINSFIIEGEVLNTVELTVKPGALLEGQTLGELHDRMEITFLQLKDSSHTDWNPRPDRRLEAGARLLVVATVAVIRTFEGLNVPPSR